MFKLKEKQESMKLAAKEFADGADIKTVMLKYGVSYSSVYNAIKRYGIDYKFTYGRKIFFNENFFSDIKTEEQAYWLGFLFADGCISKTDNGCSRENRITIAQSVKDFPHLKLFAESIDISEKEIKFYTPNGSYSQTEMVKININSMKMADDLKSLGFSGKKDQRVNIPSIERPLIRHFIRGFFDGDGCVSGNTFEITSSGEIPIRIQEILITELCFNKTKIRFTKNSYNLRYGGKNQLKKIFHYLYDDANFYLKRKYDNFYAIAFATDETISSSSNEELRASI